MSDVILTIRLPEALAEKAKAANLEIESVLIDALERKLREEVVATLPPPPRMPTREEVELEIRKSEERIASGLYPLRTFDLSKGTVWVSDDFDDPLPDEFWFGSDEET
jgi:hypothetical protein